MGNFDDFLATRSELASNESVHEFLQKFLGKGKPVDDNDRFGKLAISIAHIGLKINLWLLRTYHEWLMKQMASQLAQEPTQTKVSPEISEPR